MPMPEYFVLNDETVKNSHGFRLLNSGGNFERFKENPVMLDAHDMRKVAGKWDNLRIDGKQLKANPVFDVDDDESKRLAGKVERGFVKAASPGIYIEEAQYLETDTGDELVVTKWELLEASVLGVPSNRSAIAFYSKEGVKLEADQVLKTVQNLAAAKSKSPADLNKNPDMSKLILSAVAATALGLPVENDNMDVINKAVEKLAAKLDEAETKRNEYKTKLEEFNNERAEALVAKAVEEGRLEATRKDSFVKLAKKDYTEASDILQAMPAKKELGKTKEGEQGVDASRAEWTYLEWAKKDPQGLAKLQAEKPEEFEKLRSGYKSTNQ